MITDENESWWLKLRKMRTFLRTMTSSNVINLSKINSYLWRHRLRHRDRSTKTKYVLKTTYQDENFATIGSETKQLWPKKSGPLFSLSMYICLSVCLSVRKLQVTVVDLGTSSSTWGTLMTRVRKVYFCFWKFSFLRILGQSLYIFVYDY